MRILGKAFASPHSSSLLLRRVFTTFVKKLNKSLLFVVLLPTLEIKVIAHLSISIFQKCAAWPFPEFCISS